MKISDKILEFPKSLPNDVDGLINYYPNKFPPVIEYFEEQARKFHSDPEGYKDYAYWVQEEMFAGFENIKNEYENGNKDDLRFLVEIEQKLSKLFCYRFWVVNYLFADGPWHEYFVDNLKGLIRKFVEIKDDVEEYERNVLNVQRDLLQTDYADLYLQQALSGVKIVDVLREDKNVGEKFDEIVNNFSSYSKEDLDEKWKDIVEYIIELERIKRDKKRSDELTDAQKEIANLCVLPLNQVMMRKTKVPLVAFLTHVVEFMDENEGLMKRHDEMKKRIEYYFEDAKKKLSDEEFRFFELCYHQSRNLSMSKDMMGDIDPFMLPFWFGELHSRIRKIVLSDNPGAKMNASGEHGSMYCDIVWHLPDDLKVMVMSSDNDPYALVGDRRSILKASDAWNSEDRSRE